MIYLPIYPSNTKLYIYHMKKSLFYEEIILLFYSGLSSENAVVHLQNHFFPVEQGCSGGDEESLDSFYDFNFVGYRSI